jgi:hypothetical protein
MQNKKLDGMEFDEIEIFVSQLVYIQNKATGKVAVLTKENFKKVMNDLIDYQN